MNVNELQSVQARERQSDSLQELRPSFYRDAADFIAELREERARVAADVEDPFEDPEVTKLTDDIRTAEGTIEAIYERRVGKIVKLASLAAADMPTEETGLTTEEAELYDTLVEAIETHREEVLATLTEDGSSESGPVSGSEQDGDEPPAAADSDDGMDAADVMGSASDDRSPPGEEPASDQDAGPTGTPREPPVPPESNEGNAPGDEDGSESDGTTRNQDDEASSDHADRTTVRITEDVGSILAVDQREYDLATDDVVTLPAENATPLIERDAAEPIE